MPCTRASLCTTANCQMTKKGGTGYPSPLILQLSRNAAAAAKKCVQTRRGRASPQIERQSHRQAFDSSIGEKRSVSVLRFWLPLKNLKTADLTPISRR